jgi:hypothetical protein
MDYNTLNKINDDKSLLLDNEKQLDQVESKFEKEKSQNFPLTNNNQNQSPDEILGFDTFFMIRCFITILAITMLSLNSIFGFFLPHNNIDCLVDKVHILFGGINEYFHSHTTARHGLIIISSICVDFIALFTSIHWTCYGKSWRIMIGLILFYVFRSLIQVIY